MFDRLGRRDDETPFIVEWFVNNGIEVWSAEEGQQRFDNHVDMSFFMLFSICASYCTLSVQKKDLGKILFYSTAFSEVLSTPVGWLNVLRCR